MAQDVFVSTDGGRSNRFYVFSHCGTGAARLDALSGCFSCPTYYRRSSINDVCFECQQDHITGGLDSERSCQLPCSIGSARAIGEDTCRLCPPGKMSNASIDRNEDLSSPRCVECPPGHVRIRRPEPVSVARTKRVHAIRCIVSYR